MNKGGVTVATSIIPITKQQWSEIQEGTKHMQDILPNLRPDMRELFISHIYPKCWNRIFGDVDREF
mgnify:CR=1 FL=1